MEQSYLEEGGGWISEREISTLRVAVTAIVAHTREIMAEWQGIDFGNCCFREVELQGKIFDRFLKRDAPKFIGAASPI
ncbi:hypothetical protein LIER_28464 [Lithospermum erythrorhizon]|uniref:Uncharacterized protein n=1 Tax=Lithospermum erythrorhizon TaxID=34254 RepID=A0AAV3RJU4_LITER